MKINILVVMLGATLFGASAVASASVITFDEIAATNNNAALSGPYLSTGVSFSATNAGIWGGITNGNPGNWGIDGTNGPQFLGFNGANNGYGEIVSFATGVSSVSVDFSRSNGSSDGTILLEAFNGATLVDSVTASLGAINSWSTLTVGGSNITSIQWTGTGTSFHPFGADNLNYTIGTVPEPASLALLGVGLTGLAFSRRKPKKL